MPEKLLDVKAPDFPKSKIVKVWENSKMTSDYTAQAISVDLSDYDAIYCIIKGAKDRASYGGGLVLKDLPVPIIVTQIDGINGQYVFGRGFKATDTSISISIGYHQSADGYWLARNDLAIPYQIYGIKF